MPSLIPPGALRGGVAVVVDVLRATTVMVRALASGCEAVVPCGEIEEAQDVAAGLPPGTALLGGERGGLPIPGFDLGNSPDDYTPEACRGKTLVITTTNGTRAILASLEAERVLVGAFLNRRALVRDLAEDLSRPDGRPIHIVCAGTDSYISLEDSLLAGALVSDLSPGEERVTPLGNDEAHMVRFMFDGAIDRPAGPDVPGALLRLGRGGRNVEQIGLGRDIDASARIDRFPLVPELFRDRTPLRITSGRTPLPAL